LITGKGASASTDFTALSLDRIHTEQSYLAGSRPYCFIEPTLSRSLYGQALFLSPGTLFALFFRPHLVRTDADGVVRIQSTETKRIN
jgi:hypothetical protein